MIGLVLANLTRLLKDTKLIIGICLVQVAITLAASVINIGGPMKPALVIVDLDRTAHSEELISYLKRQYTISLVSEMEARSDVQNAYARAAVVISAGLTDVEIVRLFGTSDLRLEAVVNNFLSNGLSSKSNLPTVTVENSYTHKQSPFALNFIINFMFYTAAFIMGEVNDLRRWRLLPRIFTTPNSSRQILGSILIALFLILFMQFLAIAAASTLSDFNFMSNILGSILLFGSFMFFVMSFGVLVGRLAKSSGVAPVVLSMVIAPLGIMSGTMIPREFTPDYLTKLDFLTPQYWVVNGVEMLNTASLTQILPNIVILLLMGLCCFTAGAFRFNDLVEM